MAEGHLCQRFQVWPSGPSGLEPQCCDKMSAVRGFVVVVVAVVIAVAVVAVIVFFTYNRLFN